MNTLACAKRGAIVTGIDFSEESIKAARSLTERAKLKAQFYWCNVYDTTSAIGDQKFDIIYTSYGVIGWLPDLNRWATIIRKHLSAGGLFYMAEFHPVVWMFDDEFSTIRYPYHNVDVIVTEGGQTYTDSEQPLREKNMDGITAYQK